MTKTLRRFIVLLMLVALPLTAMAQGAPDQIQDALALLNQELGANLTLNDMFWSWAQEQYGDTSLGCPTAGESYAQLITVGYRFEFRYNARIYDIRVSADKQIVRLCSVIDEAAEETPTPDPIEREALSNVLCQDAPPGLIYMKTQLAPGIQGVVLPGLPADLRDTPSDAGAIVGQVQGGAEFTVIVGPTCDDKGTLWWQVNASGVTGYIAEGTTGRYFTAPKPGLNLPTAEERTVITPANMANVTEYTRTFGSFSGGVASAANTLAVTGNAGSEGVWLYDLNGFAAGARPLEAQVRMTKAAFANTANTLGVVMLGADDGTIRLWATSATAPIIERVQLNSQRDAVRAIAFAPNEELMAAAGGLALTRENSLERDTYAAVLWSVSNVTQTVVLRGHTGEINALDFSPDSLLVVSASEDGTARVWDVATGEQIAQYTHHADSSVAAVAAAFSPDGAWLALGFADGALQMIPKAGGAVVVAQEVGTPIRALAFNPIGDVLASGSEDGNVTLWDMTNAQGDVARRENVGTLERGVRGLTFSADGAFVFVVGADNTLRVFAVSQG